MNLKDYDYIFLGAGCASLSIVMRLLDNNEFSQKKIIIFDKEPKTKNDRTWCFWEKEPGYFDDIVYKKWGQLLFKASTDEAFELSMDGYFYKMIRSIDFYQYCFSRIKLQKNITISYGEIELEEITATDIRIKLNDTLLQIDKRTIVFNSIYVPQKKQKDSFQLQQHFKGWLIETKQDFFNPLAATLMDFRVAQKYGTSFVYVLPLSSTKSLIEFTIFSENILPKEEYDKELLSYIENFLMLKNYSIIDEEFGVIPMTNAEFPFFKNGIYYIGTAGGQTKASTGYTFNFIQKQADHIVQQLIAGKDQLVNKKIKKRFLFYDSTLLHILSKKLLDGKTIFTTLFKKNKASVVFKFLDNETSIKEEIKLLNSLPKKIFIQSGFKEFIKMIRK